MSPDTNPFLRCARVLNRWLLELAGKCPFVKRWFSEKDEP